MAEGGTIIARKPTVALFGEAGTEIAQFIPLNKAGTNMSNMMGDNDRGSRKDRIELLVRMQDGLIAEIIDTTLDRTATVVLNVERASL
jgi:hypothetical protein